MSQPKSKLPKHTELSILQSYLLPPSALPTILPYQSFLQLVPLQHRSHPHLKRLYRDLQFQRTIDIDTVRQNIEREVHRSVGLKAGLARRIAFENGQGNSHQSNDKPPAAKQQRKRKRTSITATINDHDNDNNNNSKDHAENKNIHDEFTDPKTQIIDTTYYETSIHQSHDPKSSTTHPLTAGVSSSSSSKKHHTRTSLLQSMSTACSHLESEISELESQSEKLLIEMNEIVGGLSDLRYGRFTKLISGDGQIDKADGGAGNDTGEHVSRTVEDEVLDALKDLQRVIDG